MGKIPFQIPGTDLACETAYWLWGNPVTASVPILICLHGGPGVPSQYLRPFCSMLNDESSIPVLVYDQMGCGESTRLPHTIGDTSFWTVDLFLAELSNLISQLKISRYSMYAHNWGGMLACRHALTQPPELHKLILNSVMASAEIRFLAVTKQRAALPSSERDMIARCEAAGTLSTPEYRAATAAHMRHCTCRLDPFPAEMMGILTALAEDNTVFATLFGPNFMQPRLAGSLKDWDIVDELQHITGTTVPGGVLIINGRFDFFSDEAMAPFFTKIMARVKWVRLAESSQFPMLEEPDEFRIAVRGFLEME